MKTQPTLNAGILSPSSIVHSQLAVPPASNSTATNPKRVVIVDDDEAARLSLGLIVEQCEGFTCVGKYAAGEEALKGVPAVAPAPDLVLMDIRLPGLSGIECVRRLRVLNPSLRFVMVTGLNDEAVMTEAFEAGACE